MTKVIPGVNDLETWCHKNNREDLLAEWHPTKNGNLKPTDVTAGSNKKVWWLLPYNDPKTGKHFDLVWQAKIAYRTNGGGCPYLSGRAVWKGFNDLATVNPELAKQWHPTKNGNLKPTDVTVNSSQKVWWLFPYDDPKTGEHFDFKWQSRIADRIKGMGCPYLSGRAIWKGFNDFATTNPELAKQWHPTKNSNLKPTDVTAGSDKKVWWLLTYNDPKTGKHFDFEWQAAISNRKEDGRGCPYLSGQAVWQGFNDLATTHPELAKQWHPTKNGKLKPTDVMAGSNKKVWWLLPYDDPKTGKHFDFEWQARINDRKEDGTDCPYLPGKAIWKGFNDLATTHPELAKQWHPTKNGNLKPTDVTAGSEKKAWWLFPYDDPKTGKHFDFEWQVSIDCRTQGNACPYLSGQAVWQGFNDLATTNPELAKQWHPTKNGNLKPTDVTAGSRKKVWWLLPYDGPKTGKHFDFEWEAAIHSRKEDGIDCPYLSGKAIWKGFNDLATAYPELAEQWHPTKNGNLKPTDVTVGSNKKVWWSCPKCRKEYKSIIYNRARENGSNCPLCSVSHGEQIINNFFEKHSIKYESQYKFKDKEVKRYPFDSYALNLAVVECDGEQHFKVDGFYTRTQKQFNKRAKVDNLKTQYCKDNNIPLLRIPYIYTKKEDIERLLTEFLRTKKAPQEIIDFYSKYDFSNYAALYGEHIIVPNKTQKQGGLNYG